MNYLIVSIDTEEDMPEWRPEKVNSTRNIHYLPRLQFLFNKYDIVPTYLVSQPVIENHDSLEIIRHLAANECCEIGAHLHSWNTTPITQEEKNGIATYLSNQAPDIIKRKLNGFTDLFIQKIGTRPTSYRAGRYGFCRTSAHLLSELGYKVDSSIAPLTDCSADGGPNFRGYDIQPFWIKGGHRSDLLELPLSISLTHRFKSNFTDIYFGIPEWSKIRGIFHRLNLARLLWLRPTTYSFPEMRQLSDYILDRLKVPLLNIMFHSSEACVGTSPYNTTGLEVSKFLERLEAILMYLTSTKKVKSVTMTEFMEKCENDKGKAIFGKELIKKPL
jgi:hypothetical protein